MLQWAFWERVLAGHIAHPHALPCVMGETCSVPAIGLMGGGRRFVPTSGAPV